MKAKCGRRRCKVCHERFTRHHSAVESQKTCSKACRLEHRRNLARERREASIEEYRKEERVRQRESRSRRRKLSPEPVGSTQSANVSRTSLDAEVLDIIEQFINYLDKNSDLSRTTLEAEKENFYRSFEVLGGRLSQEVGQKVSGNRQCHEPP